MFLYEKVMSCMSRKIFRIAQTPFGPIGEKEMHLLPTDQSSPTIAETKDIPSGLHADG